MPAKAAQAAELKSEETKAETYRSQYPGSLHFDFTWDEKKGIYTNDAETLGQKLATDITKTAALALPEQVVSTQGAQSKIKELGNVVGPVRKLPEIDLEGFGLGL